MKKTLLLIFAMIFLTACYVNGRKRTYNSRTEQYRVEFLFEIDGIKVYRFWDNRAVYFTTGTGKCHYKDMHTTVQTLNNN